GEEVLMTEQRVVVEVDLRVEREEVFVSGQQEGINLEERRIGLLVSSVERLHELGCLIDQFGGQAQPERELARLIGPKADGRINRLLHNLFRRRGGDLFDVHAARARSHKDGATRLPVEYDAEVELSINRQ